MRLYVGQPVVRTEDAGPRSADDRTVPGSVYFISATGDRHGLQLVRVSGHTYKPGAWHVASVFEPYIRPISMTDDDLAIDGLELAKSIF